LVCSNTDIVKAKAIYGKISPITSVDEFFYDNPNTPWKPLPEHDLKQSPCYPHTYCNSRSTKLQDIVSMDIQHIKKLSEKDCNKGAQRRYYQCSKGCGQEIYFDANHSKVLNWFCLATHWVSPAS
jgi:hypothetical protein